MRATPVAEHRAAYDPFAEVYSRAMAEDFIARAWPALHRLLLSKLERRSRLLDLCCGSGQLARELTWRGFIVTGVDRSIEMIRLARENAPNAHFLVADARQVCLPACYEAVLSTFNSLAHARECTDLLAIFRNARAALRPDGFLLFDVTMEEGYKRCWHGSFGGSEDGMAWTVRPHYNPEQRMATNDVTVTHRNERGLARESHFCIVQRCHSESDLRSALAHSGFDNVHSYDAELELGMIGEAGRRFFLAF